jgi:hypothetical protein
MSNHEAKHSSEFVSGFSLKIPTIDKNSPMFGFASRGLGGFCYTYNTTFAY